MIKEIRIPEISENVTSGKVVNVLVQEGDVIDVDDILIEFETEKALVEIPSTAKGRIVALLAREGQEMQVGDLIVKVETEPEGEQTAPTEKTETPVEGEKEAAAPGAQAYEASTAEKAPTARAEPPAQEKPERSPGPAPVQEKAPAPERRPPAPAAPSVRRFARELGVDIHQVRGSGPGGRITEADIKSTVKAERAHAGPSAGPEGIIQEAALPDFSRFGPVETVELPAVRRLTARSVAVSWRTVAHVTQFDRADITHVQAFIRANAPKLQKKGVRLTLTAVVMKICSAALLKFPRFNASIDMAADRLIFKKYVHIGMAVDTDRGLLVPVIRDADRKSIRQLAADIGDMAERARSKKIKPDEMEGGTFTISNQGGIGGTQFTPIVMWPQAAILGVSRTSVEAVFVDGQFQPRTVVPLSLSYDHRIIDGADAARFLRWVCEGLEMPLVLSLE